MEELTQKLQDLEFHKERNEEQSKDLSRQLQEIDRQLPGLESKLDHLERLSGGYQFAREHFPNEDILGLISRLEQQQRKLRESHKKLSALQSEEKTKFQALQGLQPDYLSFQKIFPDQQPSGLEDALWQGKNELDRQIPQQKGRVDQLQVLISDLNEFHEKFANIAPAEWLLKAKEAYPHLLTDQAAVHSSIRDTERQLDDLKINPVSPSATEVSSSDLLAVKGIKHQPLHQVITDLVPEGDSRKQMWLTQAHNLLFAPVLESLEQAVQAAELFALQRLPIPVFTRDSLQQAVDSSSSLLGAVIGYESLAVRALLDPQSIEDWKQQLQNELSQLQIRMAEINQQLELYKPDSVSFRLAKSALEAIEQQAEEELPLLLVALEDSQLRLKQLQEQLAPECRQFIRNAERFLEQGGAQSIIDLESSLQQRERQLEQAQEQLATLDTQLSSENRRHLDQAEQFLNAGGEQQFAQLQTSLERLQLKHLQLTDELNQCLEALKGYKTQIEQFKAQAADIYRPGEKGHLEVLNNYLQDGGPEFMAKADATEQSLKTQRSQAENRASLKFDRIRAYLNARSDQGGTAALKKQIAELKNQIKIARAEQGKKSDTINTIRDQQPKRLQAIQQVDASASFWLRQLSHFTESMLAELPEPDLDRLGRDAPVWTGRRVSQCLSGRITRYRSDLPSIAVSVGAAGAGKYQRAEQ